MISYECLQVEKYVHILYYVDTYVKAYGLSIYLINGREERKNTRLPFLEPSLLIDAISRGKLTINWRLELGEPPAKHKK